MSLFETIKYKLINKEKNIEIRQYKDVLLASTKTQMNSSMDSGFNNVFNYISGENQNNQKISMTTPVVTYEEDNQLVTGFYVPSKYSMESAPKPKSGKVFLNQLNESIYAVIKFRGKWTEENFNKYDRILIEYINDNNYVIQSSRLILRYQPPIVPGIFRRNEIAYQIKK